MALLMGRLTVGPKVGVAIQVQTVTSPVVRVIRTR
jgi:hypothetical protein